MEHVMWEQLASAEKMLDEGNYEEAREQLFQLYGEEWDGSARVLYDLGNTFLLGGEPVIALRCYQDAIHGGYENPSVCTAVALAANSLGIEKLVQKSMERALQLAEGTSDYPHVVTLLGLLYQNQGSQFRMIRLADQAMTSSPDAYAGYHLKYELLLAQEKYEDAASFLRSCEEKFGEQEAFLLDNIECLRYAGSFDEARQLLDSPRYLEHVSEESRLRQKLVLATDLRDGAEAARVADELYGTSKDGLAGIYKLMQAAIAGDAQQKEALGQELKAGDDPNVAALADLLLFLDDYSGTVREFLKLNAMQAAATVNGAGKENEDNFYSRCLSRREGDQSAVVSDEEPTPISDPQVFAVLEGEDGPEATTIAAGVLDEMYPEIPEDSGETPEYLHRACAAINQRVCQHNDENFSGSRASLAMLLVQDYRAWACNVGHSVVVRVRDRKAEVLSVDDSTDSLGSSMRTQLTQYLGMRDEEMVLEPHVREIDFAAGDCFLVASSSLYHALPAERVVAACSGDGTEEEKLRALIDEATKEHPSEDMTGIVIGIAQ